MPTPYTPSTGTAPVFPWNLVNDGEVYNYDSIQKSADPAKGLIAKLMDAVGYLLNNVATGALSATNVWTGPNTFSNLTISGSNEVKLASRSVARRMPLSAFIYSGTWVIASLSFLVWETTSSSGVLQFPLYLPHGQVLDTVTIRYTGSAGHAAFPGGAPTMPSFTVRSIDNSGTVTTLATGTDASATAAAYEAIHDISATGIAHTIDAVNNRYMVSFIAEGGANWITGGLLSGLNLSCTITNLNEY